MQANQRSRLLAATIEVAAERGYGGTTVGKIVRLAGVSKASFYEQFGDKDECFTAACDTALRAAASAVLRGERSAREDRSRLREGLTSLAELIADQPKAAKLVLLDGWAATPAIRDHVSRRFGLFAALVRERLRTAGEDRLSHALAAGIVRGIEHHARRCVGTDHPEQFSGLVDPLLDWGLGFDCEEAAAMFTAAPPPTRRAAFRGRGRIEPADAPALLDTRSLLLAATLRLASREGFATLTPSRIRAAAGVSRRSFDAEFEDATGCFLAAVHDRLSRVFRRALRSAPAEAPWGERTYLALDALVASLLESPDLARLAFVETLQAAPAALQWRERLVAQWAAALYRGAPPGTRPSAAVTEATVAAIWGFLSDLIAADRLHLLPAQTPRLAFFAIAPVLGGPGAAEAIGATRGEAARSSRPPGTAATQPHVVMNDFT